MSKFKEEIQTDAFVTGYAKTLDYVERNRPTVYAILGSVIGLIVLFVGWSIYADNQESKAKTLMLEAESAFIRKEFTTALNGDGAMNIGLLSIASDFSFTKTGNLAAYYAAVSASQLNDFDTALEMISKFDAPKGVMGVGAIALHASILESMGENTKAASYYEKAANWDVNDATTPAYLVKAANAALKAGDLKSAINFADQVLNRYSTTPFAAEASQIKVRANAKA